MPIDGLEFGDRAEGHHSTSGSPAKDASSPGGERLVRRSTTSTFSCDIAYSPSPTASRASCSVGQTRYQTMRPPWISATCQKSSSTPSPTPCAAGSYIYMKKDEIVHVAHFPDRRAPVGKDLKQACPPLADPIARGGFPPPRPAASATPPRGGCRTGNGRGPPAGRPLRSAFATSTFSGDIGLLPAPLAGFEGVTSEAERAEWLSCRGSEWSSARKKQPVPKPEAVVDVLPRPPTPLLPTPPPAGLRAPKDAIARRNGISSLIVCWYAPCVQVPGGEPRDLFPAMAGHRLRELAYRVVVRVLVPELVDQRLRVFVWVVGRPTSAARSPRSPATSPAQYPACMGRLKRSNRGGGGVRSVRKWWMRWWWLSPRGWGSWSDT